MSQQDRPAVCSVCSCLHATAALYAFMRICAVGLQCSRCERQVSMLQHILVLLNGFGNRVLSMPKSSTSMQPVWDRNVLMTTC